MPSHYLREAKARCLDLLKIRIQQSKISRHNLIIIVEAAEYEALSGSPSSDASTSYQLRALSIVDLKAIGQKDDLFSKELLVLVWNQQLDQR